MKYLVFIALSALATSCVEMKSLSPNHIGITPSMEWEIQHHSETKYKPKIQGGLDWNL